MAHYLPKPSKGKPTPAGTWPAVCYRIIDLGTQRTEFKGEVSHKHQVMLSWELQDDECTVEFEGKVRRMTVHRKFTWSMHPKAGLRLVLESWRGKKFTDADFGEGGFDVSKLLGAPCLIGITHESRDGEVFANITSVSKMPKGITPLPLENERMLLWIDSSLKPGDLDRLSENMREKVKASPEYQELFGGAAPTPTEEEWAHSEELEEIPF